MASVTSAAGTTTSLSAGGAPDAQDGAARATDTLVALLRGDALDPHVLAECDADALWIAAAEHRVLPLVAERMAHRAEVPEAIRLMFRATATEDAVTDLIRESELVRLVADLAKAHVRPLLLKGSQLAYSHYPRADLRPRVDSDLLIPASDLSAVQEVLGRLGYEPKDGQLSGSLVIAQALYSKRKGGRLLHAVDVHWKVASPQVFAEMLSYSELAERAIPLPALGPGARGLSSVDALLVACVHRIAHHLDSDRLIWLYDIKLIAEGLTTPDWKAFLDLTVDRKVTAVCMRSLQRTDALFPGTTPSWVWDAARVATQADVELSEGYLTERSQAQLMLDDLRALPRWRDRARLIGQHVFPPASFMRRTYAPSSRAPLLVLYGLRFIRGATRWLGVSQGRA